MVSLVRASAEALGEVRPAIAFDRRLVNAEHSVNRTFPNANHREAQASKLPCRSSACDKEFDMR
jgi:hypothetical protein